MAEWIDVKERLPENNKASNGDSLQFIIYTGDYVTAAYFQCGGFYDYDFEGRQYWYNSVTHWMPLPEPPKGKDINVPTKRKNDFKE